MTKVVKERIGTRTIRRSMLSSPTAKREFHVYEDDTTGSPLTAMSALRTDGVPELGDSHPEDRQMTCNSYDISANPSSDYSQTIVCNYAVGGLDGGGTYTAKSTGVRGLFMDTWRNNPFAPTFDENGISTEDIGGTKIDQAGKPVSVAIFQQTIDIRSPFANEPEFNIIRQLTNTRNESYWEGFPAGSLLYLGVQASVTNGNVWTTTHKFAADELFHVRQIVMRNSDGKPALHLGQAWDVRWVQKFTNLSNFNLLGLST